jgi:hypothetical protein
MVLHLAIATRTDIPARTDSDEWWIYAEVRSSWEPEPSKIHFCLKHITSAAIRPCPLDSGPLCVFHFVFRDMNER